MILKYHQSQNPVHPLYLNPVHFRKGGKQGGLDLVINFVCSVVKCSKNFKQYISKRKKTMAKLKKQVLGRISGALGDIVFREVNGKNVVGMRPSNVNTPQDPASVARRAKFTISAKLAQAISSHQKLKDLWALKAPAGQSTHNFLIKSNYLFVQSDDLSDLIKLTPDAGFPVSASSGNLTSSGMELILNAIGNNNLIDDSVEVNVQMLSVLFFKDSVDISVPQYSIITASSSVQTLSLANPLTLNAPLVGNDGLLFDKYQYHKAFNVIITMDVSGNLIHYSNTLSV